MIIVDYLDGAGGEYFSYFLSGHAELLDYQPNELDMQVPADFKFLNTQSLMTPDWDNQFISAFKNFNFANKKLAAPYHLYKWPGHVEQILQVNPAVRFVNINSDRDNYLVKMDFLRKIWLRKLTNKDLPEIKILTNQLDQASKITLIQKLKSNTLLQLDIELARDQLPINRANRLKKIDEFINHRLTTPSSDITINYRDFFIEFTNTKSAYDKLCAELNFQPDYSKLDLLLARNKKNYLAVQKFIEQFNTTKETL
jgi:hypothetical protein